MITPIYGSDNLNADPTARRLALASLPWLAGPLGDGWQIERRAALLWCEDCQVSHEFEAVAVTWSKVNERIP